MLQLFIAFWVLVSVPVLADTTLTLGLRLDSDIQMPKKVEITLKELRAQVPEHTFIVKAHPVYDNKPITYVGFYFKDVVQFAGKKLGVTDIGPFHYSLWASDNFSAFISPEDMESGTAFLAWREAGTGSNRSEDGLWTMVEKHGSPGPFYLVWNNPETTYWQKWPFKLVDMTFVSESVMNKFDSLKPDDDFARTKGYRLVLKNCTACHKIRDVGFGEMGPDLAWLTALYGVEKFTAQIRKPVGKMIPFTPAELSDDDISAIFEYLKFAAR